MRALQFCDLRITFEDKLAAVTKAFLESRTDLMHVPPQAVALHKEGCDVLADNIMFVPDDSMTKNCEPRLDFHRFRQG